VSRSVKPTPGLLDFHTHSTHSDAADTPTELVERAKAHGVRALALTDHDVDSGLPEFRQACNECGVFAIPYGAELCGELPRAIVDVEQGENETADIVVLAKSPKHGIPEDYHEMLFGDRKERFIPETVKKLEALGFYVPRFDIDEQAREIGSPSLFIDFVAERDNLETLVGFVQDIDSKITSEEVRRKPVGFANKYLFAPGREAYVKRLEGFSIRDLVDLANSMNCISIIAHPGGEYGFLNPKVLEYLIGQGVRGIEMRNYFNSPEQNAQFDKLAEERRLIRSGGSDCHGDNGPFKIGMYDRPQNQLPEEVFEELWGSLPE
jgi:hypothetical protein